MVIAPLLSQSFFPWTDWKVPVVGLAAALALLVGYWLTRRFSVRYAVVPRRPQVLHAVYDPLTYGGAMERRESPRRKGMRVKVDLADPDGNEPLGTAWVVDRSDGGLCLLVEKQLAVGSMVSVRPIHATQGMPWVQTEVKSCRPEGNEWEVGCRFLRRPGWSMMLLFG